MWRLRRLWWLRRGQGQRAQTQTPPALVGAELTFIWEGIFMGASLLVPAKHPKILSIKSHLSSATAPCCKLGPHGHVLVGLSGEWQVPVLPRGALEGEENISHLFLVC